MTDASQRKLNGRPCPICGTAPDEIEKLKRERDELRRWLCAYKFRESDATRKRYRPRALPFPTSDLR